MNSKKIISAALSASLALSLLALPALAVETTFPDVASNAWYATAVEWAVKNSVTAGDTNGKFNPDATLTNAQAIQFIYASKGQKTEGTPNPWYAMAQKWGIENDYITVSTDMTASCTRLAFVQMLYSAAGSPKVTATSPFVDTKEAAAVWAKESGITSGTDATHFSPDSTLTRKEAVQFLYSADKAAKAAGVYDTDASSEATKVETTMTVCTQRIYTTQYSAKSDPSTSTITYSYDGAGREIMETTTSQSGSSSVKTSTYNDEGALTQEETKYSTGESYKIVYSYDADGRLAKQTMTNSGSKTEETITYAYDSKGLVTQETASLGDGSYTKTYGYDSNGNLITVTYVGADETYNDTYRYVNDLLVKKTHKYSITSQVTTNGKTETKVTDSGTEITDYNYDGNQLLISAVEKDKNSRIAYATSYAYDSNSMVATVTRWAYTYNAKGGIQESVKTEDTHYYDASGNEIYHEQKTGDLIVMTDTLEYETITVKR